MQIEIEAYMPVCTQVSPIVLNIDKYTRHLIIKANKNLMLHWYAKQKKCIPRYQNELIVVRCNLKL